MNKNIVYCICSYLSNDSPMVTKFLPLIKDMETWAHAHNADFKLITRIPDVIEDMFSSITTIYKQRQYNELNEIGQNILKHANHTTKKKNYKKSLIHKYKAWNTKFEIIHDFYKSDYERMIYLDCDLYPCRKKRRDEIYWELFDFELYDNVWYMKRRHRPTDCYYPVILAPEKHLKRYIDRRYLAGIIFLTKNYKHNLAEILSYNNIYDSWLLDCSFVREETAINYIVHKNNICNDIMPDKGSMSKDPTILHHFPFVHIGGKLKKINFTYENQWLIKT